MKLKDQWREYVEHKETLWEKYYTYVGYWNKLIMWMTHKEMLNHQYLNYTEEYKEYKNKANNVLSYQVYKNHRKKKSMQELIEEKKPNPSKRQYNIEYRKKNKEVLIMKKKLKYKIEPGRPKNDIGIQTQAKYRIDSHNEEYCKLYMREKRMDNLLNKIKSKLWKLNSY